ncbi:hypothetical protein CNMCM6936_009566 [Aspergillus lentulus]|nr:hypothetical protein CNMCM6936_009566 [Aspergillus lentulus]
MCQDCEKQRKAPPSTLAIAKPDGTSESSSDKAGESTALQAVQKVEGLTINNYGHISFFNDKPVVGVPGPFTSGATDAMRDPLSQTPKALNKYGNRLGGTSQSTDRTACIGIENNLPVTLSEVILEHHYSDWGWESRTWWEVDSNTSTTADFKASYQTGSLGTDHWKLTIYFEDGAAFYTGENDCMMREADDSQYGPMWFQITRNRFNINLRSGACGTLIGPGTVPYEREGGIVDIKYDAYFFVSVYNMFPVSAVAKMDHHFQSGPPFYSNYIEPIISKGRSGPWIVYSNPGGSDYWNISVQLDVVPPINRDDTQEKPFKNRKENKECAFSTSGDDSGRDITIDIYPGGWTIDMPSGRCTDSWITPLGYNTVAFIAMKNNFAQNIRYVSLTHQYSSDLPYIYEYPYILVGQKSSQFNMVEYKTGSSGYDYWTVDVFLADDTHYQNTTPGKRCFMRESDATTLTFGISESTFNITLPSGSCEDKMTALGAVDVLLGAELDLPYNKNCYLAAHNAFANYADGFIVANQALSISNQLCWGASTLLLDIWVYNDDIYLLHAWGEPIIGYLANNPFATPVSLLSALKAINQYMTHFDNVITIIIEDKIDVSHRAVLWSIFQEAGVANKVFWPSPDMQKDNDWPTLWEMLQENQRLVVFSDYNGADKVFPYQWDFMSENVYGPDSLNQETWTQLRQESRRSQYGSKNLMAMNHFPWVQAGQELLPDWFPLITHANTPDFIREHVMAFQDGYNITPNWLNLDFIDVGGGILNTLYCNAALHNWETPEALKLAAGRFIYKKVFEQPTIDGKLSQLRKVHKKEKHDIMNRVSNHKPTQIDSMQDGAKDGPVNYQPKPVTFSHG